MSHKLWNALAWNGDSPVNLGPEYTLPQQERTQHCGASPRPLAGLPVPCSSWALKIVSEAWHWIGCLQCLSISLSGVLCYLGLFWAILVSCALSFCDYLLKAATPREAGGCSGLVKTGALSVTLPLTGCKAVGKLFNVFTSASSFVSWREPCPLRDCWED